MAVKLDYVLRETGSNLTRNVTLTLASVLTVVVSLTLFGSALLLQQGVENANDRFKGGIEFIVYLQPDVTQEQRRHEQDTEEERHQPECRAARERPVRASLPVGGQRVRPGAARLGLRGDDARWRCAIAGALRRRTCLAHLSTRSTAPP